MPGTTSTALPSFLMTIAPQNRCGQTEGGGADLERQRDVSGEFFGGSLYVCARIVR